VSTFLAYLRQQPGSGVAIGVLVVLALVSLFAPIVAPHDPNQTNLIRQFEPPSGLSFSEPTSSGATCSAACCTAARRRC
jgi:ABC-type antimicrobial peptide transport system permease subunit